MQHFLQTWRQNLSVATVFWALCLSLVLIEATIGANWVVGTLFFLSIPAVVALLTWTNRAVGVVRPRQVASVFVLGLGVLATASLIIFVGLYAAAHLKRIVIGV